VRTALVAAACALLAWLVTGHFLAEAVPFVRLAVGSTVLIGSFALVELLRNRA
jgi:hypothetical protein